MWFYDKHSAFIDECVKINHIRDFLTDKTLKLWMTKQHHSDMLNNSIWHDHPDQIDTVDQLFDMIIKTCGELNQQEQIKHDYYSLMQTSSVCDFLADLLFLMYHINLSSSQDTVCDHFRPLFIFWWEFFKISWACDIKWRAWEMYHNIAHS